MFSSYFICLLIFGFVKLAFAPVLVEIEFALSVSIAYLLILHAFEMSVICVLVVEIQRKSSSFQEAFSTYKMWMFY